MVFLKVVLFRFAFLMFTPVSFKGYVLFQDRLVCHITALRCKGYLVDMSQNVSKKHEQSSFYEASSCFIGFVFDTFSTIFVDFHKSLFHLLPVNVHGIQRQRTNYPYFSIYFSDKVLIMRISSCIKINLLQ